MQAAREGKQRKQAARAENEGCERMLAARAGKTGRATTPGRAVSRVRSVIAASEVRPIRAAMTERAQRRRVVAMMANSHLTVQSPSAQAFAMLPE